VCRCDESLKAKTEGAERLSYTGLCGGLEQLKIETRLINEMFASVMGEYVILTPQVRRRYSKQSVVPQPSPEYFQSFISAGRRTPLGGSGNVHCFNAQAELLKLQKSGQFPDELESSSSCALYREARPPVLQVDRFCFAGT
jgi:hypothetical protein